jgi:uncharacterized protein (TIGR00255 family)
MTGFGSAERGGFKVEIRSLNHRFIDISVKLPPSLLSHEPQIRNAIRQRFERGRFDVYVSANGAGEVRLSIDESRARELYRALGELKKTLSLPGEIDIGMLLASRELVVAEEVHMETDALYEAFGEAVGELTEMREREGGEIAGELRERAGRIEALNEEVISLCPGVMEAGRERFLEKLKTFFPGDEYEEGRLLQEAASVAEKSDISEETARIRNHMGHLGKILSEGGAVGRKIDFLLQELNREVNTVASKSEDYRILQNAIEMKSEIEKSREQAQNIQ